MERMGEGRVVGGHEERRRGAWGQMLLACVPMKIRERDTVAHACAQPRKSERVKLFVARGN